MRVGTSKAKAVDTVFWKMSVWRNKLLKFEFTLQLTWLSVVCHLVLQAKLDLS